MNYPLGKELKHSSLNSYRPIMKHIICKQMAIGINLTSGYGQGLQSCKDIWASLQENLTFKYANNKGKDQTWKRSTRCYIPNIKAPGILVSKKIVFPYKPMKNMWPHGQATFEPRAIL